MKGKELQEAMHKGTAYVEYQGLNYEVLYKFRHVAWIRREGVKKSVRLKNLSLKSVIEGESTFKGINTVHADLKKLWDSI